MFDFSIGYPVVTLGFGVKTYVSYRLRWVLDEFGCRFRQ